VLLNKTFRNNSLEIHSIEGIVSDKSLIRTKFDFDYGIPGYEQMIIEMYEWVLRNRQLYPHYNF